jgi:hypothetical protein
VELTLPSIRLGHVTLKCGARMWRMIEFELTYKPRGDKGAAADLYVVILNREPDGTVKGQA